MRYYFHSGDSDVVSDEDGEVHADDDAACAAALQALSECCRRSGIDCGNPGASRSP